MLKAQVSQLEAEVQNLKVCDNLYEDPRGIISQQWVINQYSQGGDIKIDERKYIVKREERIVIIKY